MFQVSPAPSRAGSFRKKLGKTSGSIAYTYKVLLRVAQGWRCEASYPGSRSIERDTLPQRGYCRPQRVGNNAFSVRKTKGDFNPG